MREGAGGGCAPRHRAARPCIRAVAAPRRARSPRRALLRPQRVAAPDRREEESVEAPTVTRAALLGAVFHKQESTVLGCGDLLRWVKCSGGVLGMISRWGVRAIRVGSEIKLKKSGSSRLKSPEQCTCLRKGGIEKNIAQGTAFRRDWHSFGSWLDQAPVRADGRSSRHTLLPPIPCTALRRTAQWRERQELFQPAQLNLGPARIQREDS